MTDVQKEESQKTVVSFTLGLLIGGLLVWAFMGDTAASPTVTEETPAPVATSTEETTTDTTDTTEAAPAAAITVAETGSAAVANDAAGQQVSLGTVVYPIAEGWIGVREYNDGRLGFINGVIRFSQSAGINPSTIPLVTPTVAGRTYAIVMFTEGGEAGFNSAGDIQLDTIFTTFTAK